MTKSLRAVETLSQVDPEFIEMCHLLYGPQVDPQTVWSDVFGKRDERKREGSNAAAKVGLASNYLGIAAGGAGLAEVARRDTFKDTPVGNAGKKVGRLIPRRVQAKMTELGPRKLAYGAGGLQVLNLAGDAINNRIVAAEAGRKSPVTKGVLVPVTKADPGDPTKSVKDQVKGFYTTLRAQLPKQFQPQGKHVITPKGLEPTNGAEKAGYKVGQAIAKPKNLVIGGGALVGSHKIGQRKGRKKTEQTYEAYGYSKGITGTPKDTLKYIGGQGQHMRNREAFARTLTRAVKHPDRVRDPLARDNAFVRVALAGKGENKAYLERTGKVRNHLIQAPRNASGNVGKASSFTAAGAFSKFDNDKKQAFGWASVVEKDGLPVIDRQGDYIGIDDIEQAAYTYIRKSRVAGDMHRRVVDETGADSPFKAGEIIESVVFTPEKVEAMGLPKDTAGKWWIGVQVEDEDTWQHVKKQARTGFSIHGRGKRQDTTVDKLNGYS